MKPYLITAFHRPNDLNNLLDNYFRQQWEDLQLIVVVNGSAKADFKTRNTLANVKNITVLESAPHQSFAKNTAIDWICLNGGGYWITFDADDYYGPKYTAEMFSARDKGDLIGKACHYWWSSTDKLRLWKDHEINALTRSYLHGATLCSDARNGLRFKDTGPAGEDWELVLRLIWNDLGECYSTSQYNYVWIRSKPVNHTFGGPDWCIVNFSQKYGHAEFDADWQNAKLIADGLKKGRITRILK